MVNRKQANSSGIFSLQVSIMVLIFAENRFLFSESSFLVREAEVADISVPKANNSIIQFYSHNFQVRRLI